MIFSWQNRFSVKVALFAIFFASLAPSISHVLASQSNSNRFVQEICSTNGQKLYIEVLTSKGQMVKTALDMKPVDQEHEISHHLNHCPFCYAGAMDVILPEHSPAFVLFLERQAALLKDSYQAPYVSQASYRVPLTRGPPNTKK